MTLVLVLSAATIIPAATADAVPAAGSAVGPVDSANGFATYYQGGSGDRVELCLDGSDPNCVLPTAGPGFDPAQPTVFPTNFPDEAFYTLAESAIQVPPVCDSGTGGKVFIALGLEAAFANGGVAAGDQMSFGRIRVTGTGLCKNATYRFVHPFGEVTVRTDSKGLLRRNESTSDVGCVPAATQPCDWAAALDSPVANGWLRWDSGAPAGYLGDFAVAHTVTGGTYVPPGETTPTNSLRVYLGTATTPIVQTNLWNVAGKLAGPIVAAPAAVAFGGQPVGTISSPITVTLRNLDKAAVTVTGATIADAAFAIDNNTCTAALPRDATCQISLRFTPSAFGSVSTVLVVTHDGVRSPFSVPVTGTGVQPDAVATATPSPASLDFGNQRVGVLSSTQRVTITAGGNTPLQITAVTTQGDAAADFVVVHQDCVGAVVAAGSTCTVDVAASTTATSTRTAQLKLDSNATPTPTLVAVAANGTGGVAAVSSTVIPEIGYPSWYQDENGVRLAPCYSGSDPLCILPPATPPFFDPAVPTDINAVPMNMPDEFFYTLADSALLSTPGCPTANPPIESGKAFIRMALEGAFANGDPAIGEQIVFGRIRAFANGLCPNTEYSFTNPYGVETFTTDAAGFIARKDATQDIGCFPAAGATCDWTLPIQSRVLSGFLRWDPSVAPAAPAGYTGDSITPHRVVGGSYVPAGATTPVDYLRLEQLGGPDPVVIAESNLWTIAGKFAGPVVADPSLLSLADTEVGASSSSRTVDVVNLGQSTVTITGPITVAGANAGDFAIVDPTPCLGAQLAANAKCTLGVTFSPTATGHRNATIIVNHSSLDSPLSIGLAGLGLAAGGNPAIGLTPSAIDFGTQRVGATSPARTVTIDNNGGSADLVIAAITPSSGFVTTNNTCVGPVTPNTGCTIDVAFAPTAAGTTAGTLDITDNVGGGVHHVTLAGIGFDGVAAVSGVDPTTSFPRWYGDADGLRLGLCLDRTDPTCILPPAEPNYDPTLPVVFPSNFPTESFYSIVDAQDIATDGCPGGPPTTPGTASLRIALEAAFANGAPIAGDQMTFTRIRFMVDSGLCANTTYSFVHPYGVATFTTDGAGGLPKNQGTIDVGCATPDCNFAAALRGDPLKGFLRWDPNVTPAAPAGHIGDAITYHRVVGGSGPEGNIFKIERLDGTTVSQTNLFLAAGRIARAVAASQTAIAFGDQLVDTSSAARTVTVTNDGLAPLSLSAIGITGTTDFAITGGTCNTSVAIPTAGSCTVAVTFSPTTPGTAAASLSIAGAPDGPISVALSGRGIQSTTTTTVVANFDPTAANTPVTFTANVTAAIPATGIPTGSVVLRVDGVALAGPASLDSTGKATLTTSSIAVAGSPHAVTAEYSGDAAHLGSTSGTVVHTVVAKLATTTALTSSKNPSAAGDTVTFTAAVTPQNASLGTPTGTMQFAIDGVNTNVSLAAGVATITVSTLTAGNHAIGATYQGTATLATSSSSGTQVVNATLVTLSGTVVTATAAVLPGSVVEVFGATSPLRLYSATAGAGGAYSVALPPGTYKLHVIPSSTLFPAFWVGGASQAAATTFTINANTTRNIVVPAFTLSGSVTNRSGVALPGSIVEVYRAGTSTPVLISAIVSNAGLYSVALPPGNYILHIVPKPTSFKPFWFGGSKAANATVIALTQNRTVNITVR